MAVCNLQHKGFRCYIKSIQHFLKRNIYFNAFIISLVTKKWKSSMHCKIEPIQALLLIVLLLLLQGK